MFIPVRLIIGLIVFFAQESSTRPSRGHRRRQADSSTPTALTQNVIPIIPSYYDIPELQLSQNKEPLYPTNLDGIGNLIYLPQNSHSDAKREEEMLSNLNGFRGIPNLMSRERKILQRGQRKQPKPEDLEPCGHFQRNDYNMLTSIISKMSPEARNALIDALLKTLTEKSKVSATKSGDIKFSHPLDAAMQPPLRVNQKTDGPLVQPFSLTVEREKLRDLYKYLNNEKFRSGLQKTNVMVNLGELLQESIKKECTTSKKPCCHHRQNTKPTEACTTAVECTTPQMREEADNSDEMCNYGDQYSDGQPMDFPPDKVINLTQIFNVKPKLLIVNTGQLAPTDIAGLLGDVGRTECNQNAQLSPTTTTSTRNCQHKPNPANAGTTQPTPPGATTARHSPTRFPNNHRKCTRRQCCRHGCRHRYDRRGHANPVRDLAYAYYVDMDDPPTMDE